MQVTARIGIIGSGFARTTQIPGFLNCRNAQVTAIASARREHAEEVAREFGIPAVVGAGDATSRLRNGQLVTVDGGAGTVQIVGH